MTHDVLDKLRAIVGPSGYRDRPEDVEPYLLEPRRRYHGRSPLVLLPASSLEVAEVVRVCADTGTPIVPQGGNTSMVGGAIPFEDGEEIVVSLSRMNRLRALDAVNSTMTVEAGCSLDMVQRAAAEAGKLFPLRIASEGTCEIGGNIATNAGGTAVLRYGMMRELVLGLEVVLPDGRVWDGLRTLRKDNTGYDLKQLFIGAEGTLGIITAAVLRLFARPAEVETAFAAVPSPTAALELFGVTKDASADQVTGFELLPRFGLELVLRHIPRTRLPLASMPDWCVLIELSGGAQDGWLRRSLEKSLEQGIARRIVTDAVIAMTVEQADAMWRLRDAMSDAQRAEGASIKCDVSVPVSRVPEFLDEAVNAVLAACPGSLPCTFGHVGDGNIHFNLSQPKGADARAFLARWDEISSIVHEIVYRFGGSIAAEHGVGRMKRDAIIRYKSAIEMELMRAVKRALDPKGIMNRGKVVLV